MKDQDRVWLRFIGEGAAIVVSILLAFAIDAWWDERGQRIEEQQVLQGLQEEFTYIREILSGHLDDHIGDLEALEAFMVAVDDGVPAEQAGSLVDAVVRELMNPMTTDLGSGTLEALLSSGRIEILGNQELRARLASWEGVIGEVWDDQALAVRGVYEFNIPYFLEHGVPAGSAMQQWYAEWPVARRMPSDDPALVSQLLSDPTFLQIVTLRYGYKRHTTDEFNIALAAVDEILAEIEASIH